jgi:hypothetical protein
LTEARGVSADGRSIVGYGSSPSQQYEAFLATLPRPCAADVARNYAVDLGDLTRLLGHFGVTSGATHANGDVDLDGDVDLNDLTEVLGAFGTYCE